MPGRKQSRRPDVQDNVIALSRFRERMVRGQRSRRAESLFAAADPVAAIRALPGDEFFYVIHELGFPEAMDILVHGTAEQVQTVLDLSVWERDRVAPEKADDWLAALVEAPPQALGRWAEGIDVELLALLMRQRARIHDLSVEEEPEESEGVLWRSPDRLFALDIGGDPDQARVTQRLFDSLYRYSPGMMRRLLVGVRAETDAELEETAYRWRAGRLADLGFADFHEALTVYQELDPTSVRIGGGPTPSLRPRGETPGDGHLHLPAVITDRLSGRTPFARGVAGLADPGEAADLHFALVALANRALSADRVAPGDDEAVRVTLERVSDTLDLAVEYLARGAAEKETAAVRSVPLVTLHRLGVSLVGKVRSLALALRNKNPFAPLRPTIDIFEPEDAEVLACLARARPLFPRTLETPPAPGERPFASLADLTAASRAVERAGAALELILALGVRPAQLDPEALGAPEHAGGQGEAGRRIDPAAIDTGCLARTILVARLLGLPPSPLPALSTEQVEEFKNNFTLSPKHAETTAAKALTILQDTGGGPLMGARREVALRWAASLYPLGPVVGQALPSSP